MPGIEHGEARCIILWGVTLGADSDEIGQVALVMIEGMGSPGCGCP